MLDIIDGLIEHYQGICNCDIIDDSNNRHDSIKSYASINEILEKIAVPDAPTAFGDLSYSILSDVDNNRITAEIDVPSREKIGQINLRLRHPDAATIQSVNIPSGTGTATIAEDGETVIITGAAGQISIEVRY